MEGGSKIVLLSSPHPAPLPTTHRVRVTLRRGRRVAEILPRSLLRFLFCTKTKTCDYGAYLVPYLHPLTRRYPPFYFTSRFLPHQARRLGHRVRKGHLLRFDSLLFLLAIAMHGLQRLPVAVAEEVCTLFALF